MLAHVYIHQKTTDANALKVCSVFKPSNFKQKRKCDMKIIYFNLKNPSVFELSCSLRK